MSGMFGSTGKFVPDALGLTAGGAVDIGALLGAFSQLASVIDKVDGAFGELVKSAREASAFRRPDESSSSSNLITDIADEFVVNQEEVRDAFKNTTVAVVQNREEVEGIGDAAEAAAETTRNTWVNVGEFIEDIFRDAFEKIKTDGEINFRNLFDTISPKIAGLAEQILGFDISGLLSKASPFFDKLGSIGSLKIGGTSIGIGDLLSYGDQLFNIVTGNNGSFGGFIDGVLGSPGGSGLSVSAGTGGGNSGIGGLFGNFNPVSTIVNNVISNLIPDNILPSIGSLFGGGGSSLGTLSGAAANPGMFFPGGALPAGVFPGSSQAMAMLGPGGGFGNLAGLPTGSSGGAVGALGLGGGGPATGGLAATMSTMVWAMPLAMGALGIISGLLRPDPPRSAAGINAMDGRFGVGSVVTGNDGDPAVAQALGDSATAIANGVLDGIGATLADGAQLGNIGMTGNRFASTVEGGLFGDRPSTLGILGLPEDRREFTQTEDGSRAAVADFVSRSLIKQVQDGTLEGVTEAAGNTLKIGLGNIARNLEFDGLSEEAFQGVIDDIDFVANFDRLRDSLLGVGDVADDAARRLEMAEQSQAAFNRQLTDFQAQAAADAAEAGSGLSGLGDFVDRAERLFDPTGGERFQTRLALAQGTLGGTADVNDPFRTAVMFGEDGASETLGDAFSRVLQSGNNDNMIDRNQLVILGQAFDLLDEQLGRDGKLAAGFRRLGEELQVSIDDVATLLQDAGVTVTPVDDPFFDVDDRDRVAEALQIAKAQVDDFFSGITGGTQAPLFEQITPELSPLVEQFETLRAQIEATRPDLEALNEDLARYGETLIDVDGKINDAIATVRQDTQDQFLTGLGIAVGGDGTIQDASVDFGSINTLASTVKGLDLNAATLFEDDPRGLLPDVQAKINDTLVEGLNAILSGAEDYATTLEQIELIFGDRISGLDLIAEDPQDNDQLVDQAALTRALVAARQQEIEAARERLDVLRDERLEADRLAKAARSVANSLRGTADSLLIDNNLSTLSPHEQLLEAERQFEEALALANDSTPSDEASLEAAQNLGNLTQQYLREAQDYYAGDERFAAAFQRGQEALRSTADRQVDIEREQLSRLASIDDEIGRLTEVLASNENQPSYVQGGDGQYVSTGLNGIPANLDLGYNPENNLRIYQALTAAGISFPGAGEGQLGQLRQQNLTVNAILEAMGFADGGLVVGGSPGRDSVLAALTPGERVQTVEQNLMFEEIHRFALAVNDNVDRLRPGVFADDRAVNVVVAPPDYGPFDDALRPASKGDRNPRTEDVRSTAQMDALVEETRRLRAEVSAMRDDNAGLRRGLERALAISRSTGRAA